MMKLATPRCRFIKHGAQISESFCTRDQHNTLGGKRLLATSARWLEGLSFKPRT